MRRGWRGGCVGPGSSMMVVALRTKVDRGGGDAGGGKPVIVGGSENRAKLIRGMEPGQDIRVDMFCMRIMTGGASDRHRTMDAGLPFAVVRMLRTVMAIAAHGSKSINDGHHCGVGIIRRMRGCRPVAAFAPDIHLKVTRDRGSIVESGVTLDAGL